MKSVKLNENILLFDLQDSSWSEFNSYKGSYDLTQIFGYNNDDLIHEEQI